MGSYQSGQMGLTVTQLAYAFGGSNPSLPTTQFANVQMSQCANNWQICILVNWHIEIAEVAQSIEH